MLSAGFPWANPRAVIGLPPIASYSSSADQRERLRRCRGVSSDMNLQQWQIHAALVGFCLSPVPDMLTKKNRWV